MFKWTESQTTLVLIKDCGHAWLNGVNMIMEDTGYYPRIYWLTTRTAGMKLPGGSQIIGTTPEDPDLKPNLFIKDTWTTFETELTKFRKDNKPIYRPLVSEPVTELDPWDEPIETVILFAQTEEEAARYAWDRHDMWADKDMPEQWQKLAHIPYE